MKKIILLIFCMISQSAFCYGLNIVAGGRVGYENTWYGFNVSGNYKGTSIVAPYSIGYSFNKLNFGTYCDLTYLRIDLGYSITFGSAMTVGTFKTTTNTIKEYTINLNDIDRFDQADVTLLLKYPFHNDDGSLLWPALGVQYSSLVSFTDKNGKSYVQENVKNFNDMHDWYLVFGGGVDVKMSDNLIFTPTLLLGFNLTPKMDTKDDKDVFGSGASTSYYGLKLQFNLGAGFIF